MDEGQCWMWSKRKYSESSNHASTTKCNHDDYSWEEQAFAKDAAGSDCIWPPRSYSCSFCTREFRSAQALGGHMNVHRRDRARLKQQPHSPKIEVLETHHHHDHHPHNPVLQDSSFTTSLDYLSSLSGLAYSNTNPNSDPSSHVFASPSNKVLAAAASVNNKINCREKALIPLYNNSSIFHESSPAPSSKSWSNLAEDCRLYYPEVGAEKISKGLDFGCRSEKGNDDKTHHEVAVCLNLFVCRAHTPVQFESTKETEKGSKKRKTDHASISIPFFSKSNSVDRSHDHVQSQMFEFSPGSNIEELDLELRLGYRPKV